ncbi:MAG: hypothetical protein LUI07_05215 [Lachnospiraceae bacterium]|nr:hypothetical protein [Lachnospiraceae bacterium]
MKKPQILYRIWLIVLAFLLIVYSLEIEPIESILWGTGSADALFLFLMMDLLCILMLVTGRISWCGGISEEKAAGYSRQECIRAALWQLAFFAAATVLYLYYCFGLENTLRRSSTRDTMTAALLLCAAAVLSVKRLNAGKND